MDALVHGLATETVVPAAAESGCVNGQDFLRVGGQETSGLVDTFLRMGGQEISG